MNLQSKKIIVAGGTSGIGLSTAQLFKKAGALVTVTGRNIEKLDAIKTAGFQTVQVDSSNSRALETFFTEQVKFDHVVIALGSTKGAGKFMDLSLEDLRVGFEEKYWSHLNTLKAAIPHLKPDGSITLITAITATGKIPGTSGLGAVNGALEIMVPILAKELKPIRINAVSPGVVDTPWWDFLPQDVKKETFKSYSSQITVGRIARPNEIAEVILFLAQNEYMTGKVIACDGGLV